MVVFKILGPFCLLTLSILRKFSADNILIYFSYFCQKTGFDISMETIYMKCRFCKTKKKKKKKKK